MDLREREKELRQDLTNYINKNDYHRANDYKCFLSTNLIQKEPPEYEEAISLLEEASEGFERILGPSHRTVAMVKNDLAAVKEMYAEHLASNSNGHYAGNKRKRDDDN